MKLILKRTWQCAEHKFSMKIGEYVNVRNPLINKGVWTFECSITRTRWKIEVVHEREEYIEYTEEVHTFIPVVLLMDANEWIRFYNYPDKEKMLKMMLIAKLYGV